jgi:ribosomal protein S3
VGLKVLSGQRAAIDTTAAAGRMIFGVFGVDVKDAADRR